MYMCKQMWWVNLLTYIANLAKVKVDPHAKDLHVNLLSGATGKSQKGAPNPWFSQTVRGCRVWCVFGIPYITRDTNPPPPTVWENHRFGPPPLGDFLDEALDALNNSVTRPYFDIASHLVKKLSLWFLIEGLVTKLLRETCKGQGGLIFIYLAAYVPGYLKYVRSMDTTSQFYE